MAKVTLDDITSNYASVVQLNARFQIIEDTFNSLVLYRDNPDGEPNSMQNDLDMNSNDILNCSVTYTDRLVLDGVEVTAGEALIAVRGTAVDQFTGTGSQTVFTLSEQPDSVDHLHIYIDGIYQLKASYSISVKTLTFSEAPPLGSEIEVMIGYNLAGYLPAYMLSTNNLSELGDAAAARSNLGLVIGTDVQAYDATILNDADIGVSLQAYDADTTKNDVANVFTATQTFDAGYTETVYALTGTTPVIDPANGTIQTWAVSGASTPTENLASGQSVTLMVVDSGSAGVTWPSVVWVGGSAPTLATSGYTVMTLWKVGSTLYGSATGDVA